MVERLGDACPDPCHEIAAQSGVPHAAFVPNLRERFAEQHLHGDEELTIFFAQLVNMHDVGLRELAPKIGFVNEHRDEIRIVSAFGSQHFENDGPTESLRAVQAAEVDRRHSAFGELAANLVSSERSRHGCGAYRAASLIDRGPLSLPEGLRAAAYGGIIPVITFSAERT